MATFAGTLPLINNSASDAAAFRANGVPKEAVFTTRYLIKLIFKSHKKTSFIYI